MTSDKTNSFTNKRFYGNDGYISNLQTAWGFTDLLDKLFIGSGITQGVTDLLDMVFTSLQIRQGSGESETTDRFTDKTI